MCCKIMDREEGITDGINKRAVRTTVLTGQEGHLRVTESCIHVCNYIA